MVLQFTYLNFSKKIKRNNFSQTNSVPYSSVLRRRLTFGWLDSEMKIVGVAKNLDCICELSGDDNIYI